MKTACCDRTCVLAIVGAAWLLGGVGIAPAQDASAPRRPNIVFLLADDLGSHDVSWRGSQIKTPNLDKLAMAGARLDQFYVQPVCSPTRGALMTGRYPFRLGLQVAVVRPWADYGLPLAERTLPQALGEVGYETAIVGKWHLGHARPEYLPTSRGFEHQYGHYNGSLDYYTHIRDGGFDWHRDDRESHDEGYSTHLLAREATRIIKAHTKNRPLFLYVPFNAVHGPHQVPESYRQPYSQFTDHRRTYAGMVSALDEAVGQIVAAIDAEGLRDNTLFIFSSDNGGPAPGETTDNGPLRAGKGTIYEGGVRTCAFATWKDHIKPCTIDAALHIVDWYPTLVKLTGAPQTQALPVDGRDLWPALTAGAASPHEEIVLNSSPYHGAIRVGDMKLVLNGDRNVSLGEDPQKTEKLKIDKVELFNLAAEVGESRNLADEKPDVVKRLRARYDALAAEAAAPMSRPKPRGFESPKVWGQTADGAK